MAYERLMTQQFLNHLAVPAELHGIVDVHATVLQPVRWPVVAYRHGNKHTDLPFCAGMVVFTPNGQVRTHIEFAPESPAWEWFQGQLNVHRASLEWMNWDLLINILQTHQDNLDNQSFPLFKEPCGNCGAQLVGDACAESVFTHEEVIRPSRSGSVNEHTPRSAPVNSGGL